MVKDYSDNEIGNHTTSGDRLSNRQDNTYYRLCYISFGKLTPWHHEQILQH